jgi:hypothetical protein
MNGRDNGPLSPVSIGGGNEWSGISKYQNLDTDLYSANGRGQLATPPISSGSNSTMNGSTFSPRGAEGVASPNGPSPPSSIARSSNGNSLYGSTLNDPGRRAMDEQIEATLSEHYVALKRYLAQSLRDEKGNPKPNKARDKLLRLSAVQFQELSTDVFDELLRRQASSRQPPVAGGASPNVPPYLTPKDAFHPKRNQARQKLSTLPPTRFRDLATDVFYELERRVPRFAGGDISRTDSPASMLLPPSRTGTPMSADPGYRPDSRGPMRMRRPSEASTMSGLSGMSGYPRTQSRNGSYSGNLPGMPVSPGLPPDGIGRPQPKTFQSNTIVPNKSTMVEDDDDGTAGEDNDDEDNFNLESAAREADATKQNGGGNEADKKQLEEHRAQIAELQGKLNDVTESLKMKDEELEKALNDDRTRSTAMNLEKKEFSDLRNRLETQLSEARNLNQSLQSELDRVRADHSTTERSLREEIEELRASTVNSRGVGSSNPELERENEELRNELLEQREVTEEVRREAESFLREMRILSERHGSNFDREEQLQNQIDRLEAEVKDWRNRYARTKTQLRSLRASSIGLTIQQDASKYARDSGFTGEDGLVKDVHITKFQISIDELLQIARTDEPEKVMEYMKNVVVSVRRISQDIDESSPSKELSPQQVKLKARVSATANNLITASKNFAASKGLSPVSLLDAAASHLTSAVVELVKTVKIRPTPAGELEDDDDGALPAEATTGFYPIQVKQASPFRGLQAERAIERASAISSVYSNGNSPRASAITVRSRSSSAHNQWNARRQSGNPGNGVNGSKYPYRTPEPESEIDELKVCS